MEAALQTAISMMPMIQKLTHGEATLGVADLEQFVAYAPGKQLNFGLKPGSPIPPGSGARGVLDRNGEPFQTVVPADVFGYRYIMVGCGLRNAEGTLVGCVVSGVPLSLEDELGRMANDLAAAMQEFAATFEDVMQIAHSSNATAGSVEETTRQVGQAIASTGSMTTTISRIADKTRLLGLNASIEAAHAGKTGAGFAVVAREIQALSDQSIKAAQQVAEMLAGLNGRTAGLTDAVELMRADSERLRTALTEATAYVERLANMADHLQTLATRSEVE